LCGENKFMRVVGVLIASATLLQIIFLAVIFISYACQLSLLDEREPINLPYVWDSGIACHYFDLDPRCEGCQQSITVKSKELITAEIIFQRWSVNDTGSINQVFLLYSWSLVWDPPTHYLPLWFGISGGYPGVVKSWSFTFRAPSEPGVYYVWIRGDYASTMEEAVANIWRKYGGPPPYNDDGGGVIGKIIVEPTFSPQNSTIFNMPVSALVLVMLLIFMLAVFIHSSTKKLRYRFLKRVIAIV